MGSKIKAMVNYLEEGNQRQNSRTGSNTILASTDTSAWLCSEDTNNTLCSLLKDLAMSRLSCFQLWFGRVVEVDSRLRGQNCKPLNS